MRRSASTFESSRNRSSGPASPLFSCIYRIEHQSSLKSRRLQTVLSNPRSESLFRLCFVLFIFGLYIFKYMYIYNNFERMRILIGIFYFIFLIWVLWEFYLY